ncbi:MAG: metallophosphoesterase [Deltaproteobacteria bacterium]|nr:metallophosphoesterase [Deltaproteobacteria bacterium]
MTYKIKRLVSVLCLLAALFSVVLLPVSGSCETLRFVFLADSRSGDPTMPNPTPTDLINAPVLNAINAQIAALNPKPSFVIYGGDQAYRGCYNGTYNFQTFKNIMTSTGIPLYTVLGNHELYNQVSDAFVLANQTAYQQVFTGNPANGPSGYEQLVYSFESPGGDAFFAVLDPYYLTANVGPNPPPDITGTFDNNQLNWLTAQVAQTKATHKFLFAHGPYYYVTQFTPTPPPYPPDMTYTNLWRLLDNNRFDIFFCGHTHLYSRKTIDSSIAPNPLPVTPLQWHNNVVQVLNGTCGAPVDTGTPTVDPTLWHISQGANTYYFSVVDINGNRVTVNSYSGNTGAYSIFDTFTITKNILTAVDYLLMD